MSQELVRPCDELRRSYGTLLNRLTVDNEKLCDARGSQLRQMLSDADQLFRSNGDMCANDVALDATLVSGLADICKQRAFNYTSELLKFRPLEFANRLKFYTLALPDQGGELNGTDNHQECGDGKPTLGGTRLWLRLGRRVDRWWRPVPGLNLLLGTLPQQERPLAVRTRAVRQRAPAVAAIQPLQVQHQQDDDSTRREFLHIHHVLRRAHHASGGRPVDFFRFAYHPTCFATTVENVFHISLLVRDQLVRIFNDDGKLVLEPLTSSSNRDQSCGRSFSGEKSQQLLLELTPAEWRQVVETFEIKQPAIPPFNHNK